MPDFSIESVSATARDTSAVAPTPFVISLSAVAVFETEHPSISPCESVSVPLHCIVALTASAEPRAGVQLMDGSSGSET